MKIYTTKSRVNCGPCSFINLTRIKGNQKVEDNLAKTGKLKPSQISDWTSYLIWADKYHKDIRIFLDKPDLNSKMFKVMQRHEKISDNKMKKFKALVIKRHIQLKRKYSKKFILINNPIKKLDELLKNGYGVAMVVSDYYLNKPRKPVPHAIVAFMKSGNRYYFMDSAKPSGKTILTRTQLKKAFEINKKQGFHPRLIAYKEK